LFDHAVGSVLLDAGGVLLVPDPAAMRRALAPLGVAPDDELCRRGHYASAREVDRNGFDGDWAKADRVMAELWGVPEDRYPEAFAAIHSVYESQAWVPVEGATHALRRMQAAGLRLAVVSNASGTMEEQLLRHRICGVGVDDGEAAEVEIVVDSHVHGVEKPDPRIFDIALGEMGIGAEGAVYVGDTVVFDVVGARAAGLVPVHVDPYDWCPFTDHAHVASLADFVDRLGLAA
jgi:putative hydrolase of the HAD superfamily